MPLRRNILIFHSGALGDFVLTWPIALALARLHPQSRIFYVAASQKGKLAEKVLKVESLDIERGWHALFADSAQAPELPADAARVLAGAHTILSFISGPADRWGANVKAINPAASVFEISPVAPPDSAGHYVDYLVDQLSAWPAAQAATRQILHSIAERGLCPAPPGDGPILIHPGAGSPKKCWPAERFLELIDLLRRAGREVRLVLGEAELERWPAGQIERFGASAKVHTPATLLELLELMGRSAAFVGNDSGPGHLAGIIGLPTLTLFGLDPPPERWKALGPRVQILEGPLERIDPQMAARWIMPPRNPISRIPQSSRQ